MPIGPQRIAFAAVFPVYLGNRADTTFHLCSQSMPDATGVRLTGVSAAKTAKNSSGREKLQHAVAIQEAVADHRAILPFDAAQP